MIANAVAAMGAGIGFQEMLEGCNASASNARRSSGPSSVRVVADSCQDTTSAIEMVEEYAELIPTRIEARGLRVGGEHNG